MSNVIWPYIVIDPATGTYPNLDAISRESWCGTLQTLCGFVVDENGEAGVLDKTDHLIWCPEGRFEVRINPEKEGDSESSLRETMEEMMEAEEHVGFLHRLLAARHGEGWSTLTIAEAERLREAANG